MEHSSRRTRPARSICSCTGTDYRPAAGVPTGTYVFDMARALYLHSRRMCDEGLLEAMKAGFSGSHTTLILGRHTSDSEVSLVVAMAGVYRDFGLALAW